MADPLSQWWGFNAWLLNSIFSGLGNSWIAVSILTALELVAIYLAVRFTVSWASNYAFRTEHTLVLLLGSASDEVQDIAKEMQKHASSRSRALYFLFRLRIRSYALVCVDPGTRKLKTPFRQFQWHIMLGQSRLPGTNVNDATLSDDAGENVTKAITARMFANRVITITGFGGATGTSAILSKWLLDTMDGLNAGERYFIVLSDPTNLDLYAKKQNIEMFSKKFEDKPIGKSPLDKSYLTLVYEFSTTNQKEMVRKELRQLVTALTFQGEMKTGIDSHLDDNWKNVSGNLGSRVGYAQLVGTLNGNAGAALGDFVAKSKEVEDRFDHYRTRSGNVEDVHLPSNAVRPDFAKTKGGYILQDPGLDKEAIVQYHKASSEKVDINQDGSPRGLTWLKFNTSRGAPTLWQIYPLDEDQIGSLLMGKGMTAKSLVRLWTPLNGETGALVIDEGRVTSVNNTSRRSPPKEFL